MKPLHFSTSLLEGLAGYLIISSGQNRSLLRTPVLKHYNLQKIHISTGLFSR